MRFFCSEMSFLSRNVFKLIIFYLKDLCFCVISLGDMETSQSFRYSDSRSIHLFWGFPLPNSKCVTQGPMEFTHPERQSG